MRSKIKDIRNYPLSSLPGKGKTHAVEGKKSLLGARRKGPVYPAEYNSPWLGRSGSLGLASGSRVAQDARDKMVLYPLEKVRNR